MSQSIGWCCGGVVDRAEEEGGDPSYHVPVDTIVWGGRTEGSDPVAPSFIVTTLISE